ncbi:F-box/FBD/LRR-repeat protein At1g13570-like [Rutidosis leptorrhynchoides]|uniref:F-box/FBD/LRR-repeat protein At1g13570-like n=1 Tax=Rutidosis leptorrhynchoides TaxID=125765 RepID=UPI003A994AC4
MDRISALPPPIIETILCLLPIKVAVRTSILSREWKYRWTKIPKLSFKENAFKLSADGTDQLSILEKTFKFSHLGNVMIRRCKFFNAINQVLLFHQGPLLEFSLSAFCLDSIKGEICVELDQIISHLSRRNTVKIFSVDLNETSEYRLPLSIFSLHQLTNLHLHKGCMYRQPPFNGFRNLTSLYLHDVKFSTKTLLHLVSSCPLLKSFTLFISEDDILGNDVFSIADLLECLPVIEHLITCLWVSQCFSVDSLPQELPIYLVHLKYLRIDDMCLLDSGGLPLLFFLIRCSPNLEKLELHIHGDLATDSVFLEMLKDDPVTLERYSDIWLKNLNELKIDEFIDFKLYLEFVQLILANSPMLKKVSIRLFDEVTADEESNISRILLHSSRASGAAKLIVKRTMTMMGFFLARVKYDGNHVIVIDHQDNFIDKEMIQRRLQHE